MMLHYSRAVSPLVRLQAVSNVRLLTSQRRLLSRTNVNFSRSDKNLHKPSTINPPGEQRPKEVQERRAYLGARDRQLDAYEVGGSKSDSVLPPPIHARLHQESVIRDIVDKKIRDGRSSSSLSVGSIVFLGFVGTFIWHQARALSTARAELEELKLEHITYRLGIVEDRQQKAGNNSSWFSWTKTTEDCTTSSEAGKSASKSTGLWWASPAQPEEREVDEQPEVLEAESRAGDAMGPRLLVTYDAGEDDINAHYAHYGRAKRVSRLRMLVEEQELEAKLRSMHEKKV